MNNQNQLEEKTTEIISPGRAAYRGKLALLGGLLLTMASTVYVILGRSEKSYELSSVNYSKSIVMYRSAKECLDYPVLFPVKYSLDPKFDPYVAQLKKTADSLQTIVEETPQDSVVKYARLDAIAQERVGENDTKMFQELAGVVIGGSILTGYVSRPRRKKQS